MSRIQTRRFQETNTVLSQRVDGCWGCVTDHVSVFDHIFVLGIYALSFATVIFEVVLLLFIHKIGDLESVHRTGIL